MRIVDEIPHHTFKITVFNWNGKYLIKIELSDFEQTYKINEQDVSGIDDIRRMLNEPFLESCMGRFLSMRADFKTNFQTL